MELAVSILILITGIIGFCHFNKKRNSPYLPSLRFRVKVDKLIQGNKRIIQDIREFKNERNEYIREIRIISKDKTSGMDKIESKEIANIMKVLNKEKSFIDIDRIVFRFYDTQSKKNIWIPEVLKLSVVYDKNTIENTDWKRINIDEVINLGKVLDY